MTSGWSRKDATTPAERARRKQYNSGRHRKQHAADKRLVDSGTAHCWRCGQWIAPGSAWHSGHHDDDRSVYMGPEHADCNLRAAASKGARMVNSRREPPQRRSTRDWFGMSEWGGWTPMPGT